MITERIYLNNPLLTDLPYLEGEELIFVNEITKDLSYNELENFARVYDEFRRSYTVMILLTLLGFFGIAGIQRLYVGHKFKGILYFITCGFLYIGTIYDLFTYKRRTNEYNYQAALRARDVVTHYDNI